MASLGELGNLSGTLSDICDHDGEGAPTILPLAVLTSAAGAYLGTTCPNCGPYARKSGYFPDRATAQAALDALPSGAQTNLRDTGLHNPESLAGVTIDDDGFGPLSWRD